MLINTHPDPRKLFEDIQAEYLDYHTKKRSPDAIKKRVKSFRFVKENQSIFEKNLIYVEFFKDYKASLVSQNKQKQYTIWAIYAAIAVVLLTLIYFAYKR